MATGETVTVDELLQALVASEAKREAAGLHSFQEFHLEFFDSCIREAIETRSLIQVGPNCLRFDPYHPHNVEYLEDARRDGQIDPSSYRQLR